jgi:hypothetical protein
MLDLPQEPFIDKARWVGGCVRLSLNVDAERLKAEVAALQPSQWGTTGGRVGVHRNAEAVFLRGYAPAEGDKPIEDRELLEQLPYARYLIQHLFQAAPQRCLLAKLSAGASIALHIDRAPYFSKTLRVHIPIETNESVWMYCAGQSYTMRAGEVWVLNNSAVHGVWNAHSTLSRTHMICDFVPSPALFQALTQGDRQAGRIVPEVEQHLTPSAHRNNSQMEKD